MLVLLCVFSQVRVGSFKPALAIVLSVLYTVASNKEDSARVVVASLLQVSQSRDADIDRHRFCHCAIVP